MVTGKQYYITEAHLDGNSKQLKLIIYLTLIDQKKLIVNIN